MTKAKLTPGTYLRLRREASCLSLRELAQQFFDRNVIPWQLDGDEVAELLLAAAEIDQTVLDGAALRRLNLFVPLDREIYAALVAGLPHPPVCAGCGCSWNDACRGAAGPCAWADAAATVCTRCAQALAA